LNPELVICRSENQTNFDLTIEKVEDMFLLKKQKCNWNHFLQILFLLGKKNVKYAIENFRVEQKTDYEKISFEIKTDGSNQNLNFYFYMKNHYDDHYI
jgi:DNA-directed RNA polymerase subunit alpha